MGMKRKEYDAALEPLTLELVSMSRWVKATGARVVVLFEGRDTAGKGGAITAVRQALNPRQCRTAALPRPTEAEMAQWYFQRYVPHLPSAGEIVLFNRSWYNRAGVEPVMGFCTPEQHEQFLDDVPKFERMLTNSGVILIKFWLDISKDEQAKRLEERMTDPLKRFKVSSLDAEAQTRWDAYTTARDTMLAETHGKDTPWTVVATDDKKTARLNIIRHILHRLGRPDAKVAKTDKDVVFDGAHAKEKLGN